MPLNAEERAAKNRRNARKSTGPKSDEGKAIARMNALKHGLRAETLALPNEDPEELKRLTDDWLDYYQPASPGQRALIDRCVQATIQQQRCARFQAEALRKQVREADSCWLNERDDRLEALIKRLQSDPGEARELLDRTAHGCRYLIERWECLDEILVAQGFWCGPERDEAIRLIGQRPENDRLKDSPDAWKIRLFNLLSRKSPADSAVRWMFDPKQCPEAMQSVYRPDFHPDREDCHRLLREMIAEHLEYLRPRAAQLREAIEGPDRAGAEDRALLLDGPEGAKLLRYERMHDSQFHRAYKALLQEKRLEDEDEDEAPAPKPIDPDAVASVIDITAAKAKAPNEATEAAVAGGEGTALATIETVFVDPMTPGIVPSAVAIDPGPPPILSPQGS